MDLQLSRVDYMHIGSSFPNCLKILPSFVEKGQQRMVVANKEGMLQILTWRKGEPIYSCKIPVKIPICALHLGGIGTVKDKIFISCGNVVKGFTKRGKMFLEFDTQMAEPIENICVMGSHLFISGKNIYSQFEDCHDSGYYISDDEITSILVLPIEKVKNLISILACRDRTLKVLINGKMAYSINIEGIPTSLCAFNGDGGENGTFVMFGTSDGRFGFITITKEEGFVRWTADSDITAEITCMDFYDLTSDGTKELILGFDDGYVHVYAIDPENFISDLPRLLFSQSCNESITSIQGAIFGNEGFEEILVVTYSGWIFGLTTETADKKIRVDEGSFSISEDTRQKIIKLKTEIEDLQIKVNQEREKFQASNESAGGLSAIPFFAINDKLVLNRDDASYLLTLEVESPIDTILIQSDVPVDLLDVEKNSAVVSFSQCDQESGNFLLTTFRCQANTTRIEVRLRTIEGQHGIIRAYITPRIQPKCCQVRSFNIKALSLHVRAHSFDPNRPYNSLTLNGLFSVTEIHSWLQACLPEMPERPPPETASLTFVSSFLDTMLHCNYSKGEANFKSDNVSTISILKDCLTKEATKRKIQLDIECEFNEESVLHTLQLIRPKMDGFLSLSRQVSLIDALREIEVHDKDASQFLSPEYKFILANADKLKAALKRQPSYLDRLFGMITDLYIDKHKYNGINVKSKIPQLMDVLDRQDFDLLIDFFQSPLNQQMNKEYL